MRWGRIRREGLWALAAATALVLVPAATAEAQYPTASSTFTVAEGQLNSGEAQCPGSGDMAISGGIYTTAPITELLWLKSTRPGSLADPAEAGSWIAEAHNVTDGIATDPEAEAWAVCHTDGAGDYAVRKERDLPVQPGRQVKYFQKCRSDEAVVGGGADVSGGVSGDSIFLSTSTPRDDRDRDKRPDGWQVVVEAGDIDSGNVRMDVYAVCDKRHEPSEYRYKTSQAEVPDGFQGDATGICDVSEPRVGGGVRSHSKFEHELRINSTAPTGGTGWNAFVDNVETPDNEARKITVTAICLK